jgi:hypothetical protein
VPAIETSRARRSQFDTANAAVADPLGSALKNSSRAVTAAAAGRLAPPAAAATAPAPNPW